MLKNAQTGSFDEKTTKQTALYEKIHPCYNIFKEEV